jgi:uncharacterized membrane protein HdeD (DUF308 family)
MAIRMSAAWPEESTRAANDLSRPRRHEAGLAPSFSRIGELTMATPSASAAHEQAAHPLLASVCRRWEVLLIRGIFGILLGVLMIVRPDISLVSLVLLFGIFSLADGIGSIILGIRGEPDGTVWWTMIALGVIACGAGILTLVWPGITAVALLAIIAAAAIIRGALEIWAAISLRNVLEDEWILGLSGFLSIVFGALLLRNPKAGALAVVLLIGAYLIALGTFAIALSLRLRRVNQRLCQR